MNGDQVDFWRERITLPSYRVGEAAHYAEISPQALTYWQKAKGKRGGAAGPHSLRESLSYVQLIEVAVVASLRKANLRLDEIRRARAFIADRLGLEYPFAQAAFKTDGVDVLLDYDKIGGTHDAAKLLAANHLGQAVWADVIASRFQQFNYGADGSVVDWWLRGKDRPIVIDPRIAFGAPTVKGSPTWVLKERWKSGEGVSDIADDFDLPEDDVVQALHFEGLEVDRNRQSLWVT